MFNVKVKWRPVRIHGKKSKVQIPVCVDCLRRLGFGKKAVSRFTRISASVLHRYFKSKSFGDRPKRKTIPTTAFIDYRPSWEQEIVKHYKREQLALRPFEERFHWINNLQALEKMHREHLGSTRKRIQLLQSKRWHASNKPRILEGLRKRRKIDPLFRLQQILRSRFGGEIRATKRWASNTTKAGTTSEMLDCSYREFFDYIKKMFRDGMTWENHGDVWHLDHIKPLSRFNLQLEDEQRAAFHWTNFQPLLVKENLSKHVKYAEKS